MTTVSTHVLDSVLGMPAPAVVTTLRDAVGTLLATAQTDPDGRIRFDLELDAGPHRLTFATAAYFRAADRAYFHPEVDVTFEVDADRQHLHVALLLAPYSYTTYRGS